MTRTIRDIRADILDTYGDPTSPNYRKIASRLKEGPSYNEIRELAYRLWIKDVSDQNDEYCFSFLLKNEKFYFRLELSVVGRYAALMELSGGNALIIGERDIENNEELRILFGALIHRRSFLSKDILEKFIEFDCDDSQDGEARIYNVLFASVDDVPWRNGGGSRAAQLN